MCTLPTSPTTPIRSTRPPNAWVRRFDGDGPIGELEVVVSDTLARWRAGSIELPDYYLVLDAETWTPTRRHWYLGVLHAAAPARVVPVANADAAAAALARLTPGRWWPDLDDLLHDIDRVVPDQVGAATRVCALSRRAMFSNSARCGRNASSALPVGPLRCLATMISALPRSSEAGL